MINHKFLNVLASLCIVSFVLVNHQAQNNEGKLQQHANTGIELYGSRPIWSPSPFLIDEVILLILEQIPFSVQPSPSIGNVLSQELQIEVTPTPSPTPIPVQLGKENVPIVIGASVICGIILLTWLLLRKFASSRNYNH